MVERKIIGDEELKSELSLIVLKADNELWTVRGGTSVIDNERVYFKTRNFKPSDLSGVFAELKTQFDMFGQYAQMSFFYSKNLGKECIDALKELNKQKNNYSFTEINCELKQ